MIVSASYRTDVPAFYAEWFARRLEDGQAVYRNPYGGGLHRLDLRPEAVSGFVFWTRNPGPFLPVLERLTAAGRAWVVQFTITGYPRALEASVPSAERQLDLARAIARRYGSRRLVWRYDPVIETALTPPDWHLRNFERLADSLADVVDEVILSFVQVYAKTARNTDLAARRHGFAWRDPAPHDKRALLGALAELARQRGLMASLCSQPDLLSPPLRPASCIDAARLSDVGGLAIKARRRGNRPGCLCAESRDLGCYDSCPHGCVYCYAVSLPSRAKQRYQAHDPAKPSIEA